MTVELRDHPEGIVLRVRAQPGARRSGVRGEQGAALKVSVTQVAEQGKANRAVLAVLRKELALRASQVVLLAGETLRDKQVLIREVSIEELTRRIDEAVRRAAT